MTLISSLIGALIGSFIGVTAADLALNPEQRCKLFGHKNTYAGTVTTECEKHGGHDVAIYTCKRCNTIDYEEDHGPIRTTPEE